MIRMPTQVAGNSDRLYRASANAKSCINSRCNEGFAFLAEDHFKMIRHTNLVSGTYSSGKLGLTL